jgi:archaemetzincin
MANCNHGRLRLGPSAHASDCGFERVPEQKRIAATTSNGKSIGKPLNENESRRLDGSFPGPLILPDDDLAYDTKYPPQSLLAWKRLKERNEVTPEKRTIYVAAPPETELRNVQKWKIPNAGTSLPNISHPAQTDVIDYLSAFYCGMPVKVLPRKFSFVEWKEGTARTQAKDEAAGTIALERDGIATRIRSRPYNNCYTRQLNLEDLLDALIENLPDDAYALILVVEHDLYESEEDDFCCGRAYGGSRICVVSSARYNPLLDEKQGVEREHAWPASHCEEYIDACCASAPPKMKKSKKSKANASDDDSSSPLNLAVRAYSSVPPPTTPSDLTGLWLSRVAKTASHELGHCMGFDHCIYYACSMQSTANLTEDARQPPYLCPVDLAKMSMATGASERERYEALLEFCTARSDVGVFAGFGAWIQGVLDS